MGTGAALPDVPARDLGDQEIGALAAQLHQKGRASFVKQLIESGLYEVGPVEEPSQPAPADTPAESE